jgi:triosephosphate isomerase (TIM)
MQKKYIIANWKCNKTIEESLAWIDEVGAVIPSDFPHEIIVCPSFVSLAEAKKRITEKNYSLHLGSQSVSHFEKGAYTGEVSAQMLSGIVDYALLGHSERRSIFAESNDDIQKKAYLCIQNTITPIVLIRGKEDIIPDSVDVFAWEPVGAIGTGTAVDPQEAERVIAELSGGRANSVGIYGGSVAIDNVRKFMDNASVQGVLIGSASLDSHSFLEILNALR